MSDALRVAEDSPRTPEKGPAWLAAEAYGIDMSLVEDSLRKPVSQRLKEHDAAHRTIEMLLKAYVEQYGGTSGPA
ncbi:MAG: hypothetical protein ABMA13_15615 [Chthoniobacteraceae bacterium]